MCSAQMPLQSDIKAIFNAEKPFISHRLCNTNYMNECDDDDDDDKWKHRCVYCAICFACLTTSVYRSRVVGSVFFSPYFHKMPVKCVFISSDVGYCSHFIIQPQTKVRSPKCANKVINSTSTCSQIPCERRFIHKLTNVSGGIHRQKKNRKMEIMEWKKVFAAAQRFELNYECVGDSFGFSFVVSLSAFI